MHEASLHDDNCFITLTYAPGNLPPLGSLDHRDFQLFMKRLRKRYPRRTIRFYMCGEYGEANGRPHYHACLFNIDFRDRVYSGKSASGETFYDSKVLSDLWQLGRVSVQKLTPQTASYCARYVLKKLTGKEAEIAYSVTDPETGELSQVRPEYQACSLRPGLGNGWLARFGRDVYPHGYVVADGTRRPPPRYYDRLHAKADPTSAESLAHERLKYARERHADNTDQRLVVRETVHQAQVATLKRNST